MTHFLRHCAFGYNQLYSSKNIYKCRSVQGFTDNAVNPCIESTYTFIDHVISQLKQMHDGIQQLDIYHVGGDEVAEGAWSQSPACQRLKHNLSRFSNVSSADLKTYFIQRSACYKFTKPSDTLAITAPTSDHHQHLFSCVLLPCSCVKELSPLTSSTRTCKVALFMTINNT